MANKQSAGVILYRIKDEKLQIFLIHPGGPYWKNKDEGSWSIPKGEFADDENPMDAAIREFEEETGYKLSGNFIELIKIRQKGGKIVHAWALEGDVNVDTITSNTFTIEWPPKSQKFSTFPEIDKAAWFEADIAHKKINISQAAFIADLEDKLKCD